MNIDIRKERLTKDILKKIMEIDNTYYINAITDINWYFERYNENHYGYLMYDNDKLIGYIVSVPIKKELYEAFTNGVLINDLDINPRMFINNSSYNYIVSSVILEEYRGKKLGSKLMDYMFSNLEKGKYCALAISKKGNSLAKKRMNLIQKIDNNTYVYEIEVK